MSTNTGIVVCHRCGAHPHTESIDDTTYYYCCTGSKYELWEWNKINSFMVVLGRIRDDYYSTCKY